MQIKTSDGSMYTLSRYEMESQILWNEADNYADVWATNKPFLRQLHKLALEHPNEVQELEYSPDYGHYHVPKKWHRGFRAPKKISEEQRAKAAERLRNMRSRA